MSRIRSKSLAIRKRRISTNRAILFRLSGRIPFFPRFSHHPAQPSSFEETLYTTTVRSDCRAKLASALIASKQAAFQPFPDKSGHGSDLRRFCRGAASQEQDTGRSKQSARDLANHPEAPGYRGGPDIPKASKIVRSCLNPNRSLDTPSPFLIGEMRLSGILPASVRILFLATPRRSPLRLRLGEKHAA